MKRVLLSWSSGKDCAWALHLLRQDPEIEIIALLTTLNEEFDRVAMHAVRHELVEEQALAAGLPLWTVPLPWPCTNEEYESRMAALCQRAVKEGIQSVAFGDLFLEDVRAYRVKQLAPTGLEPLFPVWRPDTRALAEEMLAAGVRAIVTSVDPRQLPKEFVGREWNASFLADLPAGADPCGENGEFHSFVFASPAFSRTLDVEVGEIVERDGFAFADVTARAK